MNQPVKTSTPRLIRKVPLPLGHFGSHYLYADGDTYFVRNQFSSLCHRGSFGSCLNFINRRNEYLRSK